MPRGTAYRLPLSFHNMAFYKSFTQCATTPQSIFYYQCTSWHFSALHFTRCPARAFLIIFCLSLLQPCASSNPRRPWFSQSSTNAPQSCSCHAGRPRSAARCQLLHWSIIYQLDASPTRYPGSTEATTDIYSQLEDKDSGLDILLSRVLECSVSELSPSEILLADPCGASTD